MVLAGENDGLSTAHSRLRCADAVLHGIPISLCIGKATMLIPEHRSVSPTSLAFSRETLFFFGLLFLQNAHSYHLPWSGEASTGMRLLRPCKGQRVCRENEGPMSRVVSQ